MYSHASTFTVSKEYSTDNHHNLWTKIGLVVFHYLSSLPRARFIDFARLQSSLMEAQEVPRIERGDMHKMCNLCSLPAQNHECMEQWLHNSKINFLKCTVKFTGVYRNFLKSKNGSSVLVRCPRKCCLPNMIAISNRIVQSWDWGLWHLTNRNSSCEGAIVLDYTP